MFDAVFAKFNEPNTHRKKKEVDSSRQDSNRAPHAS